MVIKGQPQLVPGLEQECIEQRPIFAGRVELLDQALECRRRAAGAECVFEHVERPSSSRVWTRCCLGCRGCVRHGSVRSSH